MVRGSAASEGRDQAGNRRYKHASKQREDGDSPDHPHSSGSRAAGSQCGERGKTPRHHLLTQFPAISSHSESPRGVTVVAALRAATPVPTGRNFHDRVLRDTPRVMKGVHRRWFRAPARCRPPPGGLAGVPARRERGVGVGGDPPPFAGQTARIGPRRVRTVLDGSDSYNDRCGASDSRHEVPFGVGVGRAPAR